MRASSESGVPLANVMQSDGVLSLAFKSERTTPPQGKSDGRLRSRPSIQGQKTWRIGWKEHHGAERGGLKTKHRQHTPTHADFDL